MLTENSDYAEDVIAIISSTGKLKPYLLPEIREYYKNLGFDVIFGKSCHTPRKLTRPDDKMRARELMEAFENPRIKAVIFGRGGDYSERLIPYLNTHAIKNFSKIIIGFSDPSSILAYLVENTKSRVYHGAMATDVIRSTEKQTRMLADILKGRLKKIALPGLTVLKGGECRGVLKGGCVSVLSKLLEREHSISFNNSILFIEDINESVKSLSETFEKFRKAGKFIRIKGVLFGEMFNCAGGRTRNFWPDFIEVINRYFLRYDIPVAYNLPSGHGRNEIYLPLGTEVRLKISQSRSFMEILSQQQPGSGQSL